MNRQQINELYEKIASRNVTVGVIGMGYVGLPMAVAMAQAGYAAIGFDVHQPTVDQLNTGVSHIDDVASSVLGALVSGGKVEATTDMGRLGECDAICVCVPTPLNKIKDPDLSYVISAAEQISKTLRPGQVIILESTTFPGTTREIVLEALDGNGLEAGNDFFVCYSPERVDPGNTQWTIQNIPKVIGGLTPACLEAGQALYSKVFERLAPVSSLEAAELTKVYENTFRMINIALANELAQACDRLQVDVWEVIDAAATKPFGFMRFQPGPGLGGHCIPLDPHYLSWKMRSLAYKTRMIELASEINAEMPTFVAGKVAETLNTLKKPLNGSRILVLGVTYKPDVDDVRESPALEIIRTLDERGAAVQFHDPHCENLEVPGAQPLQMKSVPLTDDLLAATDLALIVTNHKALDYQKLLDWDGVVVDTRGALRGKSGACAIVPLTGRV